MNALVLDGVSYWYPATERPALRDVSVTVRGGEVVAVIGSVGAGRSTLLLVAAGLAPRVTGGRLAGRVTGRAAVPGAAERALLLPTPWTQLSGMAFSVADEVAFGPANLGWPLPRIRAAAARALDEVGAAHLAARDPATLSGGELQRVILAGLLAMEPAVLLLDEPTAELDPETAARIWPLLRARAGAGHAVVIATSDLDAVPAFADRVVWLAEGAVRGDGPPAAVLDADACWTAGPGGPAVAGVWRAAGLPRPAPLTVAQAVERAR